MPTMRAVVATRMGEPAEVLQLQTRPIPEPGPGQVRIRVTMVPVHASDLHTVRGRYGFVPEFPTTPGIESVGIIDEIGSGVDGLAVGQRVITAGIRGTWQEYLVADADVSRALAPGGELVVYGALSTHRQTEADKLTIPIFARSLIYEAKTVRGFWLFRWFNQTPKDRMTATINRTIQLVDSGAVHVPEGQLIPVENFSEAVYLAESPAHGGKPLLVFES
ncbi:alcohol dehydrogenase catalytic domain-containing protein [Mycolicibacterium mucogenicum]|uniref:enoyl-[acyl-carrier-protein] reductase n=1 Tax=Mycolicibacterium mucogenicum DSM 44124 TaxID=1226753 RepID=A0A8H2J8X1_MYCMU|nr:alcohol dehydrogenase catalytic domain-containing protein [Mycolicibacterium mucogenicum]KAB7760636.1 NADPH:quinone reductase [Mycolicibacterium mucogenicum DSM 44124]QPG69567.1 alcohol dehydrogenase catalytic domain-containing protein [Mycolicibacterium mucogenicum DSM 44124]